jgi:GTP-binding protein
MFIDQVEITLISGKGGNGCLSFRREKYVPKGGPDGGDGGDGGSVYIQSTSDYQTLSHIRNMQRFKAGNGLPGMGKKMKGADGKDAVILVPPGTIVINMNTDELVYDFDSDLKEVMILPGGRGGLGNVHFKSSTNQAPRKTTSGKEGMELNIRLELKLLADVGLIGLPNAGKSSLLKKISQAKPKVAPYPFTTLSPQLGLVDIDGIHFFTVADIPGLIEGAHTGTGLGDRFLRHIERTKILVHIIDISDNVQHDSTNSYDIIRNELRDYNAGLEEKNEILVLNKIDIVDDRKRLVDLERIFKKRKLNPLFISAETGEGVKELISHIGKMLMTRNYKLYGDIVEVR